MEITYADFYKDARHFYDWSLDNLKVSDKEYSKAYDLSIFEKIIDNSLDLYKPKTETVDLIEYCLSQLSKSDVIPKLRVGTDSQVHGSESYYAVVVAFDFGGRNGVHAIHKIIVEKLEGYTYHKKKFRKKSNSKGRNSIAIQERLNRETYFSLAVAYYIRKFSGITCEIDLDYSSKLEKRWEEINGKTVQVTAPLHLSGQVVQQNIGLCKTFGFEPKIKPDSLITIPYADTLCRKR